MLPVQRDMNSELCQIQNALAQVHTVVLDLYVMLLIVIK